MNCIYDSWPRDIIDHVSYRTYLALCRERDKFLKSLQETNYHDWLIDKKLVEAGGVGKNVYLYLARGNGKWRDIDKYLKYLEEGRDVTVVNAKDAFTKPPKHDYILDPCFAIRHDGSLRLLEVSVIPTYETYHTNRYIFEPKIRTDAYAYPNYYTRQLLLYNRLMYGGVSNDMLEEGWDYFVVKDGSNDDTL